MGAGAEPGKRGGRLAVRIARAQLFAPMPPACDGPRLLPAASDPPPRRPRRGIPTRLGALLALSAVLVAGTPKAADAQADQADTSDRRGPDVRGRTGEHADAPALRALRLEAREADPIRLDGRLDEPAWARAPVASGFRQREPREGAPASETTEVRVLYDERALYIGVLARDRSPERVVARTRGRDRLMDPGFRSLSFQEDDGVAILLDPFHDHRNAVVFAVNPLGAKFDALITDEGREVNEDWRGVWRAAATRTHEGWSAELEIPFRSLRYPSAGEARTWGLNVVRLIRRRNEETLWSAWSRTNEGFLKVSRAGHLTGLAELPRAGLNLEVKPYALVGGARAADSGGGPEDSGSQDPGSEEPGAGETAADRWSGRLDVGADLKHELRPGLILDLTVNPDFAQVEADDEQVNLTRFSLFFPEKRDFFLENAGVFEFGVRGFGGPPPFLLFFSRRIGIAEGEEVPVLGGVRLTGRTGRQTVGLLNVVTDAAGGRPAANHAVARVQRDVGASGYVGALASDLRQGDRRNTAGGVDWALWPLRAILLEGFVAGTSTAGPGGDDLAYRVAVDHTGDRIGYLAEHLYIGPEANPELGFVTRTDIRRSNGTFRVSPRPSALNLRKVDFRVSGAHVLDSGGRLLDWEGSLAVSPEWEGGEELRLSWRRDFTRLDDPFDLTESVLVPAGDYHGWEAQLSGSTAAGRPLRLSGRLARSRFFHGTLTSGGATLEAAWPGGRVSAGFDRSEADLPGGAFTADLVSLRLGWAPTTRLSADALLQYNSLDRRTSANVRLRLIHRPGSDLFLVLNEERGGPESIGDLRSRSLAAKLTWLTRL